MPAQGKPGKVVETEDKEYFMRRAREERARAEALPPTDPAAIVHRRLAEEYERGPQPGLRCARAHLRD